MVRSFLFYNIGIVIGMVGMKLSYPNDLLFMTLAGLVVSGLILAIESAFAVKSPAPKD